MNGSDKHSSLLRHGSNYALKSFIVNAAFLLSMCWHCANVASVNGPWTEQFQQNKMKVYLFASVNKALVRRGFWRYVNIPYITIPNARIPKLVRIPNIYTNPERNPEAPSLASRLLRTFGIVTFGIVTYGINT